MNKIVLALFALTLPVKWTLAQTSPTYYIVGTPTISTFSSTIANPSFVKIQGPANPSRYSSTVYAWYSGYRPNGRNKTMLLFDYCDYKPEAGHPAIPILYKTIDFFNQTILPQACDLDAIMTTNPTGESVEQWALPMHRKRVYFIDRSEMTETQVKLIPVSVLIVNDELTYPPRD
jgi:hypothetical protein